MHPPPTRGDAARQPHQHKLEIALWDKASRALAELHRVDEVKEIRDKAVALQTYAKQAKDTEMIQQATAVRMRAERRAGELLAEMAKNKGGGEPGIGRRGSNNVVAPCDRIPPPKLSDLGINKTQSSRWQGLAALDLDIFEGKVERASKRAYDGIAHRLLKDEEIKRAKARHRDVVQLGCTVDDLVALAASGYRAGLILADPPYPFHTYSEQGRQRSAEGHYDTLSIDEIKSLPVASLAAEDCALVLWGTWPDLPDVLAVIAAWGFDYKSAAFVWVKPKLDGEGLRTGMGLSGTRGNTEFALLATRGSPLRLAADVHQVVMTPEVVMAPIGAHSAKPEEVRRRIERLFPGPYLELYARRLAPGWTVWGNEIPAPRPSP